MKSLTKQFLDLSSVKDRQHRSRGGIGVSFVTHKVRDVSRAR